MGNVIKIKRGSGDPGSSLEAFELGWDTGTSSLYIGNGTDSTLIANSFQSYVNIDPNTGNVTIENDLSVNGSTILGDSVNDSVTLRGTVNISDPLFSTTVKGNLTVDEATTLNNTLDVTGASTISNTLDVTGNTTLGTGITNVNVIRGMVSISDPTLLTDIKGELRVDEATLLNDTLDVSGISTLNDNLNVVGNLEIGPIGSPSVTVNSSTGNIATSGNMNIGGNLTVQGSTTTVESTVVTVEDPVFTIGGDAVQDYKDRGVVYKWNNGVTTKKGFFGWNENIDMFTFIPDATNTSEAFTGNYGNYAIGEIHQQQTDNTYDPAGTLVNASEKWNKAYDNFKDGIENASQYEILQHDGNEFVATNSPTELIIDCGTY